MFWSRLLVVVCLGWTVASENADEKPISLGELPLWFVDDGGIAKRTGLFRTIHEAETLSRPVIEPERRWKVGAFISMAACTRTRAETSCTCGT